MPLLTCGKGHLPKESIALRKEIVKVALTLFIIKKTAFGEWGIKKKRQSKKEGEIAGIKENKMQKAGYLQG